MGVYQSKERPTEVPPKVLLVFVERRAYDLHQSHDYVSYFSAKALVRGYIGRSHITKSWTAIKSFIAEQLGFKLDDKEAQGIARFLKYKCQYDALFKAYLAYWVHQNTSQVFFNGDWVVINNTDGLVSTALPKSELEKKIAFACYKDGCYHVTDGLYCTIKIPFEKGHLLTLMP